MLIRNGIREKVHQERLAFPTSIAKTTHPHSARTRETKVNILRRQPHEFHLKIKQLKWWVFEPFSTPTILLRNEYQATFYC